jgi:hypothetical protein
VSECPQCGTTFAPARPRQRFCAPACQIKAANAKRPSTRGGRKTAVSTSTINKFADQMHMSVADTIDAVNALHTNTSLQLAAMCKANGVDAQAFSTHMKTYHSTDMFKAIQVHSQERDMVRAWSGHIASFKARGGK